MVNYTDRTGVPIASHGHQFWITWQNMDDYPRELNLAIGRLRETLFAMTADETGKLYEELQGAKCPWAEKTCQSVLTEVMGHALRDFPTSDPPELTMKAM